MRHPAVYSNNFIEIFSKLLQGRKNVLDPFAGTGKIALIKDYGFKGEIYCNEIEPDYSELENYPVDKWFYADAEHLDVVDIDAICTSPTYGNRMADHHEAKDNSKRITYRHCLGKPLKEGNTGKMQYGDIYRNKHISIYKNLYRILNNEGIFILNISNHIRKGEEIDVVNFHKSVLEEIGFSFSHQISVETKRMRFGKNSEKRVKYEYILVFEKLIK